MFIRGCWRSLFLSAKTRRREVYCAPNVNDALSLSSRAKSGDPAYTILRPDRTNQDFWGERDNPFYLFASSLFAFPAQSHSPDQKKFQNRPTCECDIFWRMNPRCLPDVRINNDAPDYWCPRHTKHRWFCWSENRRSNQTQLFFFPIVIPTVARRNGGISNIFLKGQIPRLRSGWRGVVRNNHEMRINLKASNHFINFYHIYF